MQNIYRGANAIILLFDVCNSNSVASIPDWCHEIKQYADDGAVVYLVGTKIDESSLRILTCTQGKLMAEKLGLLYWELSAKTGMEVDGLFFNIVSDHVLLQERLSEATTTSTSSSFRSSLRFSNYGMTNNNNDGETKPGLFSCCAIS